jgi:hypothetical protein
MTSVDQQAVIDHLPDAFIPVLFQDGTKIQLNLYINKSCNNERPYFSDVLIQSIFDCRSGSIANHIHNQKLDYFPLTLLTYY